MKMLVWSHQELYSFWRKWVGSVERDGLVAKLISFASIYHNISNNTEYESNVTAVKSENCNSYSDSENDEEETLTLCSIDQSCKKCIPCTIKLLKDFNLHSSAYSDLYIAFETLLTISFTQVHVNVLFLSLKLSKLGSDHLLVKTCWNPLF